VFVDLPKRAIDALHDNGWHFYAFIGETGVRLMCAWDTPAASIDRFVADVASAIARG
jgi:threonine aldolase